MEGRCVACYFEEDEGHTCQLATVTPIRGKCVVPTEAEIETMMLNMTIAEREHAQAIWENEFRDAFTKAITDG